MLRGGDMTTNLENKKPPKVNFSLSLDQDIYDAIHEIATKDDRTIAGQIRQALRIWLENREHSGR